MSATANEIKPGKVDVIQIPDSKLKIQENSSAMKAPLKACAIPATLSGIILLTCFFPLSWGFMAWVALVPFLCLARVEATRKRLYWSAYLAGSIFFWPILSWMRVADYRMYATWAMLATYCAIYFPLALLIVRCLDRRTRLPLALTFPLAWTSLEFIRSFALTGFAWYYLGHSQHHFLSVVQIADLGGVYLITFLIAAVNAWIFDLAYQIPHVRSALHLAEPLVPDNIKHRVSMGGFGWRPGLKYELVVIVAGLTGTLVYGNYRLEQNDFELGPRVGLLQGNLDQRIRNEASDPKNTMKMLVEIGKHYGELCKRSLEVQPKVDLLIWPETSYPTEWRESSVKIPVHQIPEGLRERELELRKHFLNDLLKNFPTNHLMGLNTNTLEDSVAEDIQKPDFPSEREEQDLYIFKKMKNYNSALLLTRDQKVGPRYDKMHRVPFGEYVPLKDWLPFMNYLAPYDFDYSIRPGEKFTRFSIENRFTEKPKSFQFGVLICYEDTDPFLARRWVQESPDGKPVDFLVNISNDGWFDGTYEHEEHLAICRFRAIETRRSVARSVNMGISAVIDGNGRILQPTEFKEKGNPLVEKTDIPNEHKIWKVYGDRDGKYSEMPANDWHQYKKVSGVLLANIPIDHRWSFYAWAGDWVPLGCWILILLALGKNCLFTKKAHS